MKTLFVRIFLGLIFLLHSPVSTMAFEGKFVPFGADGDGWDCGDVGADKGAFQITNESLTGLEYQCKLSNPIQSEEMNATVYDADCALEGTSYSQRITLMPWKFPSSEGIYVIEDGYVQQWERCDAKGAEFGAESPNLKTTFEGTYLIVISRIWRDSYWANRDDEYYVPGKVEELSQAIVRYTNGKFQLVQATENSPSGGPVFGNVRGGVTDKGIFEFQAWVNYMVRTPAAYRISVRFDLNKAFQGAATLVAEPEGFNEAYDAQVSLTPLSRPILNDATDEVAAVDSEAGQVEHERHAEEQEDAERVEHERQEAERLAAEKAEVVATASWEEVYDATSVQSSGGEVYVSCARGNRFVGIYFDSAPQLRPENGLSLKFDGRQSVAFPDSRVDRFDKAGRSRFQIGFGESADEALLMQQFLQMFSSSEDLVASVWQNSMAVHLSGAADALQPCLNILASTLDADPGTTKFDGLYKPRGEQFAHWDCSTVGQDGGAFGINGNRLTLIEEACTLTNPEQVSGSDAVSFNAQCAIEGTEYEAQISLRKTDFGVVFSGDGFSAEWLSCDAGEVERAEAERLEQERLAAKKAEAERLAAAKAEAERIAAEQVEEERLRNERLKREQQEFEQKRLEAEKTQNENLKELEPEIVSIVRENLRLMGYNDKIESCWWIINYVTCRYPNLRGVVELYTNPVRYCVFSSPFSGEQNYLGGFVLGAGSPKEIEYKRCVTR